MSIVLLVLPAILVVNVTAILEIDDRDYIR